MPYCYNCGEELGDKARFCHKCGKQAKVAKTTAKSSKKQAKKSTPKIKKKTIVIIVATVLGVVLIAVLCIFLPNAFIKSPEEVNKIIESIGYETRSSFGQSQYNYSGECVQGALFSKAKCTRENMENYTGKLYVYNRSVGDNNPEIKITYRANVEDKTIKPVLEINKVGYIDGSVDYIVREDILDQENDCFVPGYNNSSAFLKVTKECSEDESNKLKANIEKNNEVLAKLKLSLKDLDNYYKDYVDRVLIHIIEECKKDVKNGLSFEQIERKITDNGISSNYVGYYNVLVISDSTFGTYKISFYSNSRSVIFNGAGAALSGDITGKYRIYWNPGTGAFEGWLNDGVCTYTLDYNDLTVTKESGLDCKDEHKEGVIDLATTFKMILGNIGITRDELMTYAEGYRRSL